MANQELVLTREKLADYLVKRFWQEIEEQGGLNDFAEELQAYPEFVLEDLARAAVDHVQLCGALSLPSNVTSSDASLVSPVKTG